MLGRSSSSGSQSLNLGQFAGLGVANGLPTLESFKGLNDGFARL